MQRYRYIDLFLERFATPPPIPAGALPRGIFGKTPLVRSGIGVAWDAMGHQMFLNGVAVGAIGTLVLIIGLAAGVVCRKAIVRHLLGAVANAIR